MERFSTRFVARPHAIEERGEASHVEGPARTKNHPNINVFWALNHSLFKHPPDLIGKPVINAVSELSGTKSGARPHQTGGKRTHPRDLLFGIPVINFSVVNQGSESVTGKKALGECCMVGVQDVGADLQSDEFEELEGSHR